MLPNPLIRERRPPNFDPLFDINQILSEHGDPALRRVSTLMRQVSMGFAAHGVLQLATLAAILRKEGPARALELMGCIDELWYSYLLWRCAASALHLCARAYDSI